MAREEYDELENMHGLVKSRFDQSKLKLTFSIQHAAGIFGTLAPAMYGEEYYTIPQVRMATDIPLMEIHVFDCEYCKNICEPVKEYMELF